MAESLIIIPSILLGVLIGLYEALLVHRDVTVPTHRFGHMIHALLFAVAATFASMNVSFVLSYLPSVQAISWLSNDLIIRLIIGVVAVIKIHAASKVIQGTIGAGSVGLAERWSHSLIIGVLIVAAPYVYPFVQNSLPDWARR